MQKWNGPCVLIHSARNWTMNQSDIAMHIDKQSHIVGMAISMGDLQLDGTMSGKVVAWDMVAKSKQTLWQGTIQDGEIRDSAIHGIKIPDFLRYGKHAWLSGVSP